MATPSKAKGLQFTRRFTKDGVTPYDMFDYDYRDSVIKNPNGEKVFEMNNVEVPKQWSQIATDILAQKYFRRKGIPKYLKKVEESGVPEWLQRSIPDDEKLANLLPEDRYSGES
jgi:ribonucleoside-diphosphate reductase alpha chain